MRNLTVFAAVAVSLVACGDPKDDDDTQSTDDPAVTTCDAPWFPADAPWNQSIEDAAVDAESETAIAALQAAGFGLGGLRIDRGFKVLCADANTPLRTFTPDESDFKTPDCDQDDVPIVEGGALEAEADYSCTTEGNCRLLVVDPTTSTLYEQSKVDIQGEVYTGGCLAVWDLSKTPSATLRGKDCDSPNTSGLPIAPLLFSADEVAAGEIRHAIRFEVPNNRIDRHQYVRPAASASSIRPSDNGGLPYGARLRLRPDYPLDTLPNEGARVVARALQRYGMILADGGQIALAARSDRDTEASWSGLLGADDLETIEPSDFEWIEAGDRFEYSGRCIRSANW